MCGGRNVDYENTIRCINRKEDHLRTSAPRSEIKGWAFGLQAVQTKKAAAVPLVNPLAGDQITELEL
jgi:hypothetical protein